MKIESFIGGIIVTILIICALVASYDLGKASVAFDCDKTSKAVIDNHVYTCQRDKP